LYFQDNNKLASDHKGLLNLIERGEPPLLSLEDILFVCTKYEKGTLDTDICRPLFLLAPDFKIPVAPPKSIHEGLRKFPTEEEAPLPFYTF